MSDGVIKSLWRYPVKSLLGEKANRLDIDVRGVAMDRLYAVANEQGKFGSGKNTRRFTRMDGLFSLVGKTTAEGVVIEFPDGVMLADKEDDLNAKLSQALGQNVTLVREAKVSHFDDAAIHILTTGSLSKLQALLPLSVLDERRFRANIVIAAKPWFDDDYLLGKVITMGTVKLRVTHKAQRCRMIALAQGDLRHSPDVLKEVTKNFSLHFGVYASVINPGSVALGSKVEISSE